MSAKKNAKKPITSFKHLWQRLKEQKVLKVGSVGPRILMEEIEGVKATLKKLQTTLMAAAVDIGLKKGPLRDLAPKQRVQLYLYGDIPPLSTKRQVALIETLAELIGIPFQPKSVKRALTIQLPFALHGWDISMLSLLIVSLVMGFFAVYYQGIISVPTHTATHSTNGTSEPNDPDITRTPTPTNTPTPTPTPTNTPTPTSTPTNTPIITGVVIYDGLYLRDGPDKSYNKILPYGLPYGTKITILGRTKDGKWFHVKALGTEGWVWAVSVTLDDPDREKIPVEK